MKKLLLLTACVVALTAGGAYAGQGQGKGGDPEARLQRMQQHLQLTDEQVQEIRTIRADGGKREDIRVVLTEEQQATWDQHREMKQKQKQAKKTQQEPGEPAE